MGVASLIIKLKQSGTKVSHRGPLIVETQGLPRELVPVVKNHDDDGDLAVQQANLRKQLEQDWLWTYII